MSKPLNSRVVECEAKRLGLLVTNGKGSHSKITDPQTGAVMIFYHGEISTGVSCKIRKWFKLKYGVILCLALAAIGLIEAL